MNAAAAAATPYCKKTQNRNANSLENMTSKYQAGRKEL